MNSITLPPRAKNEPQKLYAPRSDERLDLRKELTKISTQSHELTMTIGGLQRMARGTQFNAVSPHNHRHVLGTSAHATKEDVASAVAAAKAAAPSWRELPFDERAAIFLRAADFLSNSWRSTLNAATMLGQSKSVQQSEIDAACELIDFLRFNVQFARKLLEDQPTSASGEWNRMEYRPLDGFVVAISPFNFTSIAANLPTAPALMGNCVVWKPASTQLLSAFYTIRLLESAGLPPGVINLVTGGDQQVSDVALTDEDFSGLHFTGSTSTFKRMWRTIADNIDGYKSYPRIVGETGGKDFVIAHPSADPTPIATALIRGAFEYQGQKCSAASRAYIPTSLWKTIGEELVEATRTVTFGDVSDFTNFGGAVIDARAFEKHRLAIGRATERSGIDLLVGGRCDDSVGYFVEPTILVEDNPTDEIFKDEYFGPILSVYVYDDSKYGEMLNVIDSTSPYALTGALFATERSAIEEAHLALKFAAGNFYVNDKPTGAVVSRQPFGGSRASGTNDKAGSVLNLLRWTSPRTIKESFTSPKVYGYPHMEVDEVRKNISDLGDKWISKPRAT
jgi:1-pyrroline-5-carboxylate dehydrogenase